MHDASALQTSDVGSAAQAAAVVAGLTFTTAGYLTGLSTERTRRWRTGEPAIVTG